MPEEFGEQEEHWYDGIDEKYHESVSRFKSADDLAKGYVNLEKSASGKVKVPGDDSSDEDWAKFYSKVGRPDKPDAYEVEFTDASPEFMDEMRRIAHESGMTKRQFAKFSKGLYDLEKGAYEELKKEYDAEEKNKTETAAKAKAEMLAKLRDTYGGQEQLDTAITKAQTAVTEFEEKHGFEGLKAYFDESKWGDDPWMIRLFSFIGDNILNDNLVTGGGGGGKPKQRWEKEFYERYGNKTG